MPTLAWPEPSHRELRSDDGSLSIERRGTQAILAEFVGVIGLAHARALCEFTDGCIDVAPVNLSLFQDLSQVTSIALPAQSHLADWAREKALSFDRLHFVVAQARVEERGPARQQNAETHRSAREQHLVTLVRAMFMALPVRSYMHRDRASFDAARARLG